MYEKNQKNSSWLDVSSFSDVFEFFVLGNSVPGGRERGHLQGCIRHEFLVVLSVVGDLGKEKNLHYIYDGRRVLRRDGAESSERKGTENQSGKVCSG